MKAPTPAAANDAPAGAAPLRVASPAGLAIELNANGSVRRFEAGAVSLGLFVGSEIDGGVANLYLRRLGTPAAHTALLGPASPTVFSPGASAGEWVGAGAWEQLDYRLTLRLAADVPAWFWHIQLQNRSGEALTLDLTYAQDLALAPYAAVRMNEYYVSQYIDHTPLQHPDRGVLLASRQNQAVEGQNPWSLIGSLRQAAAYATDALQLFGLSRRGGNEPPGLSGELPGHRLQHEHSMAVLRDAPLPLGGHRSAAAGFFGLFVSHHPGASGPEDLRCIEPVLANSAAAPPTDAPTTMRATSSAATLFTSAAQFASADLQEPELHQRFPGAWRHEERDADGSLLSFFHGADAHVVLRAKELRVLRPHGQLLRSGLHITPDERSLTSTAWMAGSFHTMIAQGHVSINRFLSATHSYLGLFRAQGQRVLVQWPADSAPDPLAWELLGVPSAFCMRPRECIWLYQHARGLIEVRAGVRDEPHALTLSVAVLSGPSARFLITHHIALNGDDGALAGPAHWRAEAAGVRIAPAEGSELARRFPGGSFRIAPESQTRIERVGGDELLFADARTRRQPYVCLLTAPTRKAELIIDGELLEAEKRSRVPQRVQAPGQLQLPLVLTPPSASPLAARALRLAEFAPWLAQNALVHYLAPRGLEQYSGGGWGTRDVCQGPVELLLALERTGALRDVLLRVMGQQNADGDWPQWFMFFERERAIRAADSHGDIVLWPLVVLAQYLIASGDAAVLDEPVGFGGAPAHSPGETATVWQHAQRALALTERRRVGGTELLAYGHGDWNDSLQPVDARMREHLCSAWTVTLHAQALKTLAQALRQVGREADAAALSKRAAAVHADFQRLLISDGVLAGYAQFEPQGTHKLLLHPRDDTTGVHYSSLAMVHAMLEELFTPQQAQQHLSLIDEHLSAPDGLRLFDRPLPYHGGPQRLFQRAESAAFFGREIGLMYMHAHLRFAQALAHMGHAERFFEALCQANPIGLRAILPTATPRQSNCYYSSSDAAFDDRYQASAEYERVRAGRIGLEGGWRVYSSGAGIALSLLARHFLGLSSEANCLRIDPVIPAALDGLLAETRLLQRTVQIRYRVGAAGCGVQALRLNGAPLRFAIESNPYRQGAALARIDEVRGQLKDYNHLEVQLG